MPETHKEQIARVEMMAEASGGPSDTWDLSDNDCAALKAVLEDRKELLGRLKVMCREWREAIGTPENNKTPGDCLERSEAVIAKVEG